MPSKVVCNYDPITKLPNKINVIDDMNNRCDEFYVKLATILTEDVSSTISTEKLANVLGVPRRQLQNAVWNGTLDIGWGHRDETSSERRHSTFLKTSVWEYFYGKFRK